MDPKHDALSEKVELCQVAAGRLCHTYHRHCTSSQFIFPVERADEDEQRESVEGDQRVSEQEAKIVFALIFNERGIPFSVETPTKYPYRWKNPKDPENMARSAHVDVTSYRHRRELGEILNADDRKFNIELKSGQKEFTRDVIKLRRERVEGILFHTLERARNGSWKGVETKIRKAYESLNLHPYTKNLPPARHSIYFYICDVVSRKERSFELAFDDGWEERLHEAFLKPPVNIPPVEC